MNAAGLRCCIEEKEAATTAYNDLSTKYAKSAPWSHARLTTSG